MMGVDLNEGKCNNIFKNRFCKNNGNNLKYIHRYIKLKYNHVWLLGIQPGQKNWQINRWIMKQLFLRLYLGKTHIWYRAFQIFHFPLSFSQWKHLVSHFRGLVILLGHHNLLCCFENSSLNMATLTSTHTRTHTHCKLSYYSSFLLSCSLLLSATIQTS